MLAPELAACVNRRREPSTLMRVNSASSGNSARDGGGAVNEGVERTRRQSSVSSREIGLLDPDVLLRVENGRTRPAHERNDVVPAARHRERKMSADKAARP